MAFPQVESWLRLGPEDVPPVLRDLIGLYLPEENIDAWLQDREAFDGRSALELLSVGHDLDPALFARDVERVVDVFYEVLAFATVPPLPTVEEVCDAVRRRQEQVVEETVAFGGDQRILSDPTAGHRSPVVHRATPQNAWRPDCPLDCAWRNLVVATANQPTIKADRPINAVGSDLLSRTWFSNAMVSFAESALPPAAPAIVGKWGSGKTSILNMIESSLPASVRAVRFNAWKHECGDRTGNVLLHALLSGVAETDDERKKVAGIVKEFAQRDAIGGGRFEDLIADFVRETLASLEADRVVVLIDDLDRCRSRAIVSVLETMSLTILAPSSGSTIPCNIITALDLDRTVSALREEPQGLIAGDEDPRAHLSRIFSVIVGLPAIDAKGWARVVGEHLPELTGEVGEKELGPLATALGYACGTVRELKHHLNQVAFWSHVARSNFGDDFLRINILLRWYFITRANPGLWSRLSKSGPEMVASELQLTLRGGDIAHEGPDRTSVPPGILSEELSEQSPLARLVKLGQLIGATTYEPLSARPETPSHELPWAVLASMARRADGEEELSKIVSIAGAKPMKDMNDCIDCSNIAICCENRRMRAVAEAMFEKAHGVLPELDDAKPWLGRADVLTSYGLFLARTGREDLASALVEPVDWEHPEISSTALARGVQIAQYTKDPAGAKRLYDAAIRHQNIHDASTYAVATMAYLLVGGDPTAVLNDLQGILDRGVLQEAPAAWLRAEVLSLVMVKQGDRELVSDEQFVESVKKAWALGADSLPDYVRNALARLANRDPRLTVDIAVAMDARQSLDAETTLALAQADDVRDDPRFAPILDKVAKSVTGALR